MATSKSSNRIPKPSGGGEEPPSKKVYTSQDQINRDNAWVKDFLARHGAPEADMAVVARDIGDPMPKFVTPDGRPAMVDKPLLQTTLPFGVGINDVYESGGQYGYLHPQYGNFVQVDPQAIYSRYGAKPLPAPVQPQPLYTYKK